MTDFQKFRMYIIVIMCLEHWTAIFINSYARSYQNDCSEYVKYTLIVKSRYLHFKYRVTGDQGHLQGELNGRVVLSMFGIIPFQQELPGLLSRPGKLGQIDVHKAQLLIRLPSLLVLW
jgi:hypothetical protein